MHPGWRHRNGENYLRVVLADKTGTGDAGKVTNDVGLITLPGGRGRLAMAVLVSGSKLSAEAVSAPETGLSSASPALLSSRSWLL